MRGSHNLLYTLNYRKCSFQVVWRKASDEHPLTIGPTTFTPAGDISVAYNKLSDTVSQWNLMIKNVRPRHAGVYECQISSRGIYTHYVALNVLGKILEVFLNNQYVFYI